LERDVPSDAIYMAYHMCERMHKDYYASDLISDILSNGRSSLFNLNLIKGKKLFSQIDAYIQGSVDPGLMMINGRLYPETSFDVAEAEIKIELNKLKDGSLTERELQKVKNRAISALLFSRLNHLNIAMELAYFEALGNAEMINQIEEKYSSVSLKNIVDAANSLFVDDNLSVIYYKSKNTNDK
jgi:predicted Zn-dependent peptidase